MNTEVMFSTAIVNWSTPQQFFDRYNKKYQFNLDVCALPENAKCPVYFTPDEDGLKQTWEGVVWMNPPYGREIPKWIEKAFQEANCTQTTVVSLLPARVDTRCLNNGISFLQTSFSICRFPELSHYLTFSLLILAIKNYYKKTSH
jgi:phage N-6-adenine-methyltransferase